MKTNFPTLYLVVPCFNEEETIGHSSTVLLNKLNELEKKKIISNKSKILFVNDGSKDETEKLLNKLVQKNNQFAMISFLANAGHQNAIYAGMMAAKDYADIVITIDADLQQDINAIEDFINKYKQGNDVVFGVRNDRNSDGAFKKFTATIYYKMMKLMGSNILANSADYRLLSKRALEVLSNYKETNLFLRGLIPSMGFNSDIVYFDVKDRELGQSKYTFKKMFNLALSGITSFSVTPIHMICVCGGFNIALGILLLILSIFVYIELVYPILFILAGIIIGSIGIVGEYVGTTNQEVKNRPRYVIDYVLIKNNRNK